MKPERKKLLVLNLPYLLFVYLFAKCGQVYRLAAGADASAKLLHLTDGISAAFSNPLPSLHPFDLCVGVAGAVAVRLIVYSKGKNAKKYRKGEEYGSARWGTAKDIAPYIDPKFENNILLTQTERLTMTGRPKDPKTARNKNVLVIGGSGSGKTRFYVKPNLMQCFPTSDYPTSFVVTDPKGTLVLETGQMFQRAGYRVKILNTINFSKSMKYNPFVYIHSEKDVLKLVNTLIANTKGEGEKTAEDFWVKSERLFYTALIGYIWYEAPAEEMNFTTLLEMINASEAREDDPDFQSPVDLMFERLEQKDPDHFAVRQYKKFLLSAGKTRSSILISCGARLAPFDIREVRELMEDDEMELDTIGDEKTVLFLIMSDTDTTFNFILAMLQSQLINLLCDRADDKYGGRLPVHVRLILDEFANIGQIPNFDKLIATIRSREISASIILQSQSQLKAIYKDWQSAQPVVPDPCGGPDHEHLVYLYFPCDLRPHDRDLCCDRTGAYPAGDHGQQRVAQHRAELFEIAFGVRLPSVPDYDCRGHLCGADTQHFGRGRHCRGHLGLHGLHRAALFLSVQDRQHQQVRIRCPLRKERLNGVCDRSQRFDPCKIQSLIRADQAAAGLLRRRAPHGRAALFFDPGLSFQQRGGPADDFCHAAGAAVRSVPAARPAP